MAIKQPVNLIDVYNERIEKEEKQMSLPRMSSNSGVSTPVSTETPSTTTPDTREIAMGEFGDLEIQRYLYESGLQNIFSDYQKNIQNLEQQEMEQLQQAYQVRELSKKYLGEYASNVGIGDVSGNLLDIYSQYAQNIGEIEQNFSALEMNLQREYSAQRQATFEELLRTQYQIDMAQLDSAAMDVSQYALKEFDRDIAGGLAYIDSQRGTLREQDYDAIRDTYYNSAFQEAYNLIQSGSTFFGFVDLDTPKSKEQYLSEIKQWADPKDYRRIEELLAFQKLQGENVGEIELKEVMNFDPTLFTSNLGISPDSQVFEIAGFNYAVSNLSLMEDDFTFDAGIDAEFLNSQWMEQNVGESEGSITAGDVVQYQGYYIYTAEGWRRMVQLDAMGGQEGTSLGVLGSYNDLPNEFQLSNDNDSLTYQGRTYTVDKEFATEVNKAILENQMINGVSIREIVNYLNKQYGSSVGEGSQEESEREFLQGGASQIDESVPNEIIFEFEGRLYRYGTKYIRPFILNNEA